MPTQGDVSRSVILEAEPSPLEIDLRQTAAIVIDMQNSLLKKGGISDLWGRDISGPQATVRPIGSILSLAHSNGCKVIYTAHRYSDDLHEIGPNSSIWHTSRLVSSYRDHPGWREKIMARGTWGADIIKELAPQPGDVVVEKSRFSAFFETSLDSILKGSNLKYLLFMGVASNVCVEATMSDASYRGYYSILVSDASAGMGPAFTHEATIFKIKACIGWVTSTQHVLAALNQSPAHGG